MQYNSGFRRSSGEAIFPGFIFQMEMPSNALCAPQERLSCKASRGRKFGGIFFAKKGVEGILQLETVQFSGGGARVEPWHLTSTQKRRHGCWKRTLELRAIARQVTASEGSTVADPTVGQKNE